MNGGLSDDALKQNSDGYQTTLNNIKDLQNLEKDLYTKLEISATSQGNAAEQTDLINRCLCLFGVIHGATHRGHQYATIDAQAIHCTGLDKWLDRAAIYVALIDTFDEIE